MTYPFVAGDVLTAADMNYLPSYTLNAQTGTTYTVVTNDQYSKLITQSNASASTVRIPTNATTAFPIGTVINVINIGVGICTINAVTSGTTTILSAGAVAAAPTLAQYKAASCIKTGTDAWYVIGGVA
jgi:hypothetical protein